MTRPPHPAVPAWLRNGHAPDPSRAPGPEEARLAITAAHPGRREFLAMISPAAAPLLEEMAGRAQTLTRRHFGRTISLYVPLYLSNYCPGGCAYCGFASNREQVRRKLAPDELHDELDALHEMGFEEVLLLTGERTEQAGVDYVHSAVAAAAERFHKVTVESFAMTQEEYARLVDAGCTGITLYQETYDPDRYAALHLWGPKRDYEFRLAAPERALRAGMRTVGLGALLGLDDPRRDALALFRHTEHLRKEFWQAGVMVSFPRIRPQVGDFQPSVAVSDRLLAQLIFAFRICCPDVPLVLSTREAAAFRDGIAGIGINKMSVASRTTVGGYADGHPLDEGQFEISDARDIPAFCAALRTHHLEPVFKNWDSTYRG